MKNFLVVTNSDKDKNLKYTKIIEEYLSEKKCFMKFISDTSYCDENGFIDTEIINNIDCVIVLGGDGTILRVANAMFNNEVAIVGVNLGSLGFLAEIEKNNITEMLECLVNDKYKIEERFLIKGQVIKNNQIEYESCALNDIVISRSGFSRIICLKIFVNGELLDIYEADGVIVSTPTGSTGYNLSAGGPIISPNTNIIVVTPISPHSLSARSIVFSGEDEIEIHVVKKRKTQKEEAIATFDGGIAKNLEPGNIIKVNKASEKVKLIKINQGSFYDVIRNKFGHN